MAVKTSWAAGDVLTAADLTDTFAAKAPLALSINAQTGTSYTLAVADSGKVVTMTNAAASTVTIPTNASVAVPIGSSVEVVNLSTGVNTTVSAAGGVTFNGGPVVLSPGSSVTLVKIGTDAWMAQGQGSPGLVHIASTTFSAAGSVSFNNCFSTAYDNYRVMIEYTASGGGNMTVRLRSSGSDNTSANYTAQYITATGTSVAGARFTTQTSANTGDLGTSRNGLAIDFYSPALAQVTNWMSHNVYNGTAAVVQIWSCSHNVSTAFDGFSLIPSAGTTSGIARVYGYRN